MPPNTRVNCRNVIREPGYEKSANEIFGDARKADDAMMGVEFTLAREPSSNGTVIEGGTRPLLIMKSLNLPFWPSVAIYYTYSETHVYLLHCQRGVVLPDED